MNLYNLRTAEPAFTITKFDSDLNPESTYTVDAASCTCPQGHRPTCRHRRMLPLLLPRVDTAWFLRFEDSTWHDPTGEAAPIERVAATAGPSGAVSEPSAGPSVSVPVSTPNPPLAGEGPRPSTFAANLSISPSVSPRGEPAPGAIRRRV